MQVFGYLKGNYLFMQLSSSFAAFICGAYSCVGGGNVYGCCGNCGGGGGGGGHGGHGGGVFGSGRANCIGCNCGIACGLCIIHALLCILC